MPRPMGYQLRATQPMEVVVSIDYMDMHAKTGKQMGFQGDPRSRYPNPNPNPILRNCQRCSWVPQVSVFVMSVIIIYHFKHPTYHI